MEHFDTFKYPGLHLHMSGHMSHLTTLLKAKAVGCWAVVSKGIPICSVATQRTLSTARHPCTLSALWPWIGDA